MTQHDSRSISSVVVHEVDAPDASKRPVLEELNAEAVRQWYRACLTSLTQHRRTVNELNVFPVPDGDTGANLSATVRAACAAVEGDVALSLPETVQRAARGALMEARGNSGVIAAQMLRALAEIWTGQTVDCAGLASGLRHAWATASEAVAEPAEGTILTVAHAAARAAEQAVQDDESVDLVAVCQAASRAAATAVAHTVDQLPALKRAGVVDAGGLGLALMLDALTEVVGGVGGEAVVHVMDAESRPAHSRIVSRVPRESGSSDYAYEVQYLLDAAPDAVDRLRAVLSGLGDSLVVVGADVAGETPQPTPTWNVHVHVNDVGAAIESGIEAGRVHRLSVTRFDEPGECRTDVGDQPVGVDRAAVVVAEAPGLEPLFDAEGVRSLTAGRPAAAEILTVLRAADRTELIIFAVDADRAAAEQAAEMARWDGLRAAVIPLRSPVQALAALAVREGARRFDDDVIAMAEAAGGCRHAEVTVAGRAALTSAGRCEAGDYLGLADGDVIVFGGDLDGVLRGLADRLCAAGVELLTLVAGAQLPEASVRDLIAHVGRRWPLVETQHFDGGQTRDLLWIGAE